MKRKLGQLQEAQTSEEGGSEKKAAKGSETEAIVDEDKHNKRIGTILKQMTPEQHRRFQHYRRSHFTQSDVERVICNSAGSSIAEDKLSEVAVVLSGISKMFVGDIIEGARTVMEERGEKGPIHPRHIRESYQRMQRSGNLPFADSKAKLLK